MTNYKSGEIVLVAFPFSEKSRSKKRPALVISSDDYHRMRQEIIIAPITSNIDRILSGDTVLKEWKESGLLFPSLVAGIIQTVKSDMIEKKLGVLSESDFQKVEANLKRALCF